MKWKTLQTAWVIALVIIQGVANGLEQKPIQRYRKILDFNHGWLFEQDDWVGLNNASQLDWDDSGWEKIRVPHTWNAGDTFDEAPGYYRGFGLYRKHFRIDQSHKDRIIYLKFGAIYTQAEIWINEVYFGKFSTGYTPIQIAITDVIRWDDDNLVAVRVHNIHNDEVPPGRWRMDYNCYGGMYREVELLSLAPVHFDENELVVTTPRVDPKTSELAVQVKVKNQSPEVVEARIVSQLFYDQKPVAKFDHGVLVPAGLAVPVKNFTTEIKNVKLWSPEDPQLYTLTVILVVKDQPVDAVSVPVGFRRFNFDADRGFFLNGRPLKLRGLNRHQCYPGLGNAVPVRLQIEDARILKSLGANLVRCSHYPQHPVFLSACDSLGLLVYEEVASWQHIGTGIFIETMNTMLEDMMRRDRNHPSIILWGLMNEGRSVPMFERLQATAQRFDPTRPTVYAENHIDEALQLGTAFIPEVLGLNYKLQNYPELHRNYPGLKLTNAECTNPDNSISGDLESEITGTLKIKADLDLLDSYAFLGGACIWSMHDYGTEYKPVWPVQKSGVVDVYRRFKEAAYYLQCRWANEPRIHVAGHWTWPGDEGKTKNVYVWHNCDRVTFYLNGKELKVNPVEQFLWQIPYQPGELKAVGQKGSKRVQHILTTAGNPCAIVLTPLSGTIAGDGYDTMPVYAQIVDANQVPVPINDKIIRFDITGSGRLLGIGGAVNVATAKGCAVLLVQSTGEDGTIVLTARCDGMNPGRCEIVAGK